jgi:hypothetical protein
MASDLQPASPLNIIPSLGRDGTTVRQSNVDDEDGGAVGMCRECVILTKRRDDSTFALRINLSHSREQESSCAEAIERADFYTFRSLRNMYISCKLFDLIETLITECISHRR